MMAINNSSMNQFINNDYNSLCDFLFSFSGNEFAIIASIAGYIIAQNLQIDQMNSLGNFFELLGQFMLSIAAQENVIKNKSQSQEFPLPGH